MMAAPEPAFPEEPPEGCDPTAWANYIEAVEDFVKEILTPEEKQIRLLAILGQIKIQRFLEEHG